VKKAMLAGALAALMAAAAEAQVTFEYSRRSDHRSLRITYTSGYYYGTGYPYSAYGLGYAGGGRYLGYGGYSWPLAYSYGYGGIQHFGSGPYWGTSYFNPYPALGGDHDHSGARPVRDYVPPAPPPRGVADRSHELVSSKEIDEGRRRWKAGDYRGALDEFRSAVVADPSSAGAQAHFALALAVVGDPKNADKALRAAAERGAVGKVDLTDLFRDAMERTRVLTALAKVSGDGGLTAAYALALAGDPERLRQVAERDEAARRLLGR
jgi:hypothetical protein